MSIRRFMWFVIPLTLISISVFADNREAQQNTTTIDPFDIPSTVTTKDIYDDWSNGARWVLSEQLSNISRLQRQEQFVCHTNHTHCSGLDFIDMRQEDFPYYPINDVDMCVFERVTCTHATQDWGARKRDEAIKMFERSVLVEDRPLPNLATDMSVPEIYRTLDPKDIPEFLRQPAKLDLKKALTQ